MQFQGIGMRGEEVTPHDTNSLIGQTIGLYIGVSGNVTVEFSTGGEITFVGVPVGWMPISVTKVKSTGTTATSIVAVYPS